MATKNIVPRADNEGQIGTAAKAWAKVIAHLLNLGGTDITSTAAELNQLHSVTLGTMSVATATDYVAKVLFDAYTILTATTDNTPAALTITEQTLIGRITGGAIAALSIAQIRTLLSITAAGAALVDDAEAAAQRATLSLGNVDNTSDATKSAAAVTLTNHRFTRRVDTQATTDTITPEISTYDIFVRTAQAHALVINNHSTSTPVGGDMMLFEILSDATIRAITYGNKYVAKAGVALPSTTVASKNLTMLFIWRVDLAQWVLLSAGQEA